ncbi:MAG: DUF3313 domain-containing protein [Syntrophobacteraceae bacterium]|nr:DUF3313 domain-containing protein [Syntrophobacteraceae bacterium]
MCANWFRSLLAAAVILNLGLAGCSSMKAKPSEGAGFVPMEEMSKREDLPFNKVWVKAGVDWKSYQSIYVKEVNTDYLMQSDWWKKGMRKDDMDKDVRKVAQYMHDRFAEAFREDPQNRFAVVTSPEPGSLTLALALTELVPSHPVMEALSIAAPYGSGVAVQAAAKESGAKATVAFEARIEDTSTGAVLAMAADREQGKVAPVNLRALTWYGEANVIIDEWADQFVQIANRRPGEVVKDTSPFTLMPW